MRFKGVADMLGRVIATATGCAIAASLSGCIILSGGSNWPRPPSLTSAEAKSVPEVPTGGVPTIREKYAPELARLTPGMTIEAFKEIFKEAAFVEQRTTDAGKTTDAYNISLRQRYRYRWDGDYYAWTQSEEVWFFFRDGKLLKWGEARQWP
jgi:hypothetical protein